ncbi:MAG: hypothetical protein DRJ31_06370 [Candidatus Methanomethylicota archaeon]|uniref:Helicase HerA central domain-containing protein n=1 Tax=Thermoproteota archaeon TaxID=2056631 RepID=A0A497EN47_9CREN|nr:MAG: hypothetical protein DRJ31_06370 [Candidatus Verstraetearchaeota archaeon]
MEESIPIGVVIAAEGVTVKFRVNEGVYAERGQLLKVIDGEKTFIVRVYDPEPVSLLAPAEVARLSLKKSCGEQVELMDKQLRVYNAAKAVIVAEVNGRGEVHGPSTVPSMFSEVYTLSKGDLKLLCLDGGDLEVGFVRSGHVVTSQKVSLSGRDVFPHHMLVCSATGGGKTNFCKVLAASVLKCCDNAYSLIIIDTEGEYFDGGSQGAYGLAHLPQAEEKLFYVSQRVKELRDFYYTFSWNGRFVKRRVKACPLEVWLGLLKPEDFRQTGFFTPPQEALLWIAYREFGRSWLSMLMDWDIDEVYRELGGKAQKSTIAVVKRKLKMFVGDETVFKRSDCKVDLIAEVLNAVKDGKVVLIDMPMATEAQEALLTVLIARRVFEAYERAKKFSPEWWSKLPTVLIVVEEAHRYLSKRMLSEGESNVFAEISKRGRKYRVGLCCITQMPSELNEMVLRQQLTKVVLPLPTKADYTAIVSHSPYLDDAENEIKTLDRGEALLVSPPSGLKFAVPVKIHKFEELVEEELALEESMKAFQVG